MELRRELRGVLKSEVPKRLDEVPYWLFRLATGSHDTNLLNAATDMAVYAVDRKLEKEAKAQRKEEEMRLVQLRGPLCALRFSRDGTMMNLFNSFESMVELAKGL